MTAWVFDRKHREHVRFFLRHGFRLWRFHRRGGYHGRRRRRDKFTAIRGGGKDEVTILVYLCGSDLESQNGMGTADLKEMANATIGDKLNLIVYTGGASRWQNSVVSATSNQIYQIKNGALTRLESSLGALP